jgi:hypothetical protein
MPSGYDIYRQLTQSPPKSLHNSTVLNTNLNNTQQMQNSQLLSDSQIRAHPPQIDTAVSSKKSTSYNIHPNDRHQIPN